MAPAQSKPLGKKADSKIPARRASRTGASGVSSNHASGVGRNANESSGSASAGNSNARDPNVASANANASNAQRNDNDALLDFLRENSSPLGNNIRLVGSPRVASSGPRQAIIVINIVHKRNGIHGFSYGFRRLEEPDKGTYIEKIHRDQIRRGDTYLLSAPLNVLKLTYGAHENGRAILNDKGYELTTFIAIQNFEGKTEQTVRHLAKVFGTAIKQHVERDPGCQNQEIVVSDDNIRYDENSVFMDFIGERNAVNLYRTILPVDGTPQYSQSHVQHARSFFREGSLNPTSVALIKSDDTFLAREYRNVQEDNNEQEGQNEQQGQEDEAPAEGA